MLKERLNKKVMLIAFLLILFLAIPSSFAGDSSAMDIADNSSFNDNLAISSADSQVLDDSSGSIGNGNDAILNEENGNLDDSSNSNSMDDSNLDTSNDYKKSNLGSNKISDGTIWANDDLETSYGSLAEAIANAQSGNTIVCIEPTTETLNNITINKNLTIKALNLGDAILKSNGKNVFYLNRGYTLNLINLTFDDYSTDMQVRGAAVYGYGDMYVENCKFSNLRTSTSISYGGVIYSDDYSKITIINSTFDNIVTCIGVAHVSRGNLDIINSSFNKIYSYGYGGAVYSWGSEV